MNISVMPISAIRGLIEICKVRLILLLLLCSLFICFLNIHVDGKITVPNVSFPKTNHKNVAMFTLK